MRFTRRHLQIALGVLWLLDGVLQLQPFMFGTGFAHDILAPAAAGQPGWVAGPVTFAAGQVAAHPALYNTGFALGQLALGAGLLLRRTRRAAILASIAWALGVWWFGEGLGGLASGHASLITGAPGAVVLYALLAAAAWPGRARGDADRPPSRVLAGAWTVVWVGGALLQLLPGQNRASDTAHQLTGLADGAPGWLASLNRIAAHVTLAAGGVGVLTLAAAMAVIGLGVLSRPRMRATVIVAGGVLAALFWLIGQNLGALYTGQATDPNTGPLLLLLAVAVLSSTPTPVAHPDATPAPQALVPHQPGPARRALQPLGNQPTH